MLVALVLISAFVNFRNLRNESLIEIGGDQTVENQIKIQ